MEIEGNINLKILASIKLKKQKLKYDNILKEKWKIWIDTGGTFTDCISQSTTGEIKRLKVLSSSCLRGKLISINSPTEIEVELLQKIPPHFSLGQSIRVLGENTELFKITKQETQNKFSISKPLNKKIISGNPDKIKKIYDTWVFSRDTKSSNPNVLLTVTESMTVRKGKYGPYIFYKTAAMKKPRFLKLPKDREWRSMKKQEIRELFTNRDCVGEKIL